MDQNPVAAQPPTGAAFEADRLELPEVLWLSPQAAVGHESVGGVLIG